jgi:signal transduction histidine kinase
VDQLRLTRLLSSSRALVSELDAEALLEEILSTGRELTGARYAALGILDGDRQELGRFVTAGVDDGVRARIGALPRGEGVLGLPMDGAQPVRVDDVASHPRSFGFPPGHPEMTSFLGVPIRIDGEVWGNLYLADKDQGPFDEADEETMVLLADCAAVALRNARRYGSERDRRIEVERALRVVETTSEIARALGGEVDLEAILELTVKRARALVGATSVVLGLLEGDDVVMVHAAGAIDRSVIGVRAPVGASVAGEVVRLGRARRLSDLDPAAPFVLRPHTRARAALYVPLLFRGRALGVLAAFDRLEGGPEFGEEDRRLLEAFAGSAASAVATGQLVERVGLQRTIEAAESERRRWARELHDDMLQGLGAVKLLLQGCRDAPDPEALRAGIDAAVERLGGQADGLRRLINDLRPASLDRLGLAPAIETLAERVRADAPCLEVDLDLQLEADEGRVGLDVEVAAFRIVQEALTNVMRHARADQVQVRVLRRDAAVEITVSDDGRGLTAEADTTTGVGLIGMRERAAAVGGTLEVCSPAGGGTRVRAVLPLTSRSGDGRGSGSAAGRQLPEDVRRSRVGVVLDDVCHGTRPERRGGAGALVVEPEQHGDEIAALRAEVPLLVLPEVGIDDERG